MRPSMVSVDDCFDKCHVGEFLRHARMRAAQPPPVQDPIRGPHGGVRFHRGTVQLSPPPLGARLSIADQLRKESSSRDWFPQANTVYRNGVGPIVVGVSFIQEIGENGMAKNEVIERFAIQESDKNSLEGMG